VKFFLSVLVAILIAGIWFGVDGQSRGDVSFAIFLFVLIVLMMNPVKFQSPEKREEYIQKIRTKKEQKLALAQKQKEERLRLKKEKQEREAQYHKELKARIKK